ncbi:hypothetical protein J7443_23500 [Tropicibacter sp. R15_0]|uniref:hypothetical protein n=1 Tax=Tropicibacter sp. R15_0 TaxID=2821101 RepID=UPI001ADD07E2|nr:hypothetical protein [Tropicibacter sp. R15_0]MBO9468212.1 hypothetical protein [Tropicibacter sp. R15_0]
MGDKYQSWHIHARGRFKIVSADNSDLTPSNRKERAIVALLATCNDFRASRLWLQSILWSNSPAEKSASSLRTALKNLRRAFSDPVLIDADRHEVWLTKNVQVTRDTSDGKPAELLELVDAPDPAFDEWLRDLRAQDPAVTTEPAAHPSSSGTKGDEEQCGTTLIIIRSNSADATAQTKFLETVLADTISQRFESEGADTVFALAEPSEDRLAQASTILHLEMVSVTEAGFWSVHLRCLADKDRRFLCSDRLRLALETKHDSLTAQLSSFVSRAISQIMARYYACRNASVSPLMMTTRAAARLYDPSLERVIAAEQDLSCLETSEAMATSISWRGFAKLVRCLEFRESNQTEEARALAQDAVDMRPGNPLVVAIAARIEMDLIGDLDYADWLVQAALGGSDGNPYVLQAAARIALKRGRTEDAQRLAQTARLAADGLPHAFAWDVELCLTALALGDFSGAHDAARRAHRSNTRHRASLRYLIATSLLVDDQFEAKHAADRLAGLESGFRIEHLRKSDYPIHTLQNLGLVGELQYQ